MAKGSSPRRVIETLGDEPRARDVPALDEYVVRPSPFVRHHLNVHGMYSFLLPELFQSAD